MLGYGAGAAIDCLGLVLQTRAATALRCGLNFERTDSRSVTDRTRPVKTLPVAVARLIAY